MISRIITILLFVLLSCTEIAAQFENDYTPLRFTGNIPEAFLNSTEKGEVAKRKSSRKSKKKLTRRQEKAFNTVNNYALKQSLQSGAILFNDELSQYVQEVADRALVGADDRLKKKLSIYVTRYANANASAWKDGTIYINVGLLSRLESEAELAFIICHEATHVKKRHALRGYEKKREIERKSKISFDNLDDLAHQEDLLNLFRYRKKYEFEADEGGFELFSQSAYAHEASLEAMEILRTINSGARDTLWLSAVSGLKVTSQIDSSWIAERFGQVGYEGATVYNFPKFILNKDDNDNDDNDDEDLVLGTHPSIDKRKEALQSLIEESEDPDQGKRFIVSMQRFEYYRTLAAFENVERYLYSSSYLSSLYTALELVERFPENQYLHEAIGKSLYWLAHYRKFKSLDNIIPRSSKVNLSSGYGQVFSLVKAASKDDKLTDLSSKYNTYYAEKYADNDVLAFLALRSDELAGIEPDYSAFLAKFPKSVYAPYAASK